VEDAVKAIKTPDALKETVQPPSTAAKKEDASGIQSNTIRMRMVGFW